MKRTCSLWLAASLAAALCAASLGAATRPRYGGTLRIELQSATASPMPATWRGNPAEERLAALLYDRLVRFDDSGRPQPELAISWQHDAARRSWQFRLRAGVRFHDGTSLTPSPVVAALESVDARRRLSVFGDTLVIESAQPMPNLLAELASARGSIFRRSSAGQAVGTGPFRLDAWEPGRHARLVANDDYWAGRPFLDAVEISMGRPLRDQWVNFELGKADLVELPPEEVRRAVQEGRRTWTSMPVELLAIVFTPGRAAAGEARLRAALSGSIDRDELQNVLLALQGEAAGALLPQWVSGYAFLFPAARELAPARAHAAELASALRRVSLVYDAADALAQRVAERIAVNAREAGFTVQVIGAADPSRAADADARLVRLRIHAPDPFAAFTELTEALPRSATETPPVSPEQLYAAERALLDSAGVIPVVRLPDCAALGARVRGWSAAPWGAWRLEEVWLAPEPAGRARGAR